MANGAEWRKVETTTTDGPEQTRTETSYVFGAEYNGVFVPAVTKSAGYFEHLVERGQAQQQADADAQAAQQQQASQQQTGQQQTPQGQTADTSAQGGSGGGA